ncbi:ABC transporter ATP-binding protein/permease [Desulfobacter vibrioformis]|uniref:ABC transporter ATP-binding protein/permease n=1 Tax=Desulfobacter vibrioformis TaxID=34031 RepID=UPI000553B980|nr:ABC transporter ATP-binding protein/permease [Desulfobacter vibrioformis]
MSDTTKYATFKETYEAGKMIAGDHAADFKRSLSLFALAYTMQGGAYLSIYGVMAALFSSPVNAWQAWIWFGVMAFFVLINVCARWFAHDFEYTDTMANITHDMRSKLGKKLRAMPLEVLSSYKTGDLNPSFRLKVKIIYDYSLFHF